MRWRRRTFGRLVLPLTLPPLEFWADRFEDVDARGATLGPDPVPTAGDIERTGTFGGGPGSAPGERRCKERCDGPGGCIILATRLWCRS